MFIQQLLCVTYYFILIYIVPLKTTSYFIFINIVSLKTPPHRPQVAGFILRTKQMRKMRPREVWDSVHHRGGSGSKPSRMGIKENST